MQSKRKRRNILASRKQARRKIATFHIERLLELAIDENSSDPSMAARHAALAWKISTKFNSRLASDRLLFCHSCKKFILPPDSSRLRLSKRRRGLNITCRCCNATYRKIF